MHRDYDLTAIIHLLEGEKSAWSHTAEVLEQITRQAFPKTSVSNSSNTFASAVDVPKPSAVPWLAYPSNLSQPAKTKRTLRRASQLKKTRATGGSAPRSPRDSHGQPRCDRGRIHNSGSDRSAHRSVAVPIEYRDYVLRCSSCDAYRRRRNRPL